MDTLLDVAFLLAAIGWIFIALVGLLGNRSLPDLPAGDGGGGSGADPGSLPRVAVIVPTRDEGERVERTVRRLLAQRGIDLQLVVVDDRSTDGTADMLRALGREDPRLRVIRIDEVPEGWLGKCYACHLGAREAAAEWLLFMDADAWCGDDVVARSLAAAVAEGADHLCLVPGLGDGSLIGRSAVLMISFGLLGIALGINRDLPFSYVGVGAFTLIRRAAYDAAGGHERVRMEVVEDMAIGYFVRRQGRRSRLFAAIDDLEVRWAHSAPTFVGVLEKNLFAKMGFRLWRASSSVAMLLLGWGLPLCGIVAGTPAGLTAAIAMAGAAVPATLLARRYRWPWVAGLLAPLALILLPVAVVNSVWQVIRRGGIRWRDTFYPLADLRAGLARID